MLVVGLSRNHALGLARSTSVSEHCKTHSTKANNYDRIIIVSTKQISQILQRWVKLTLYSPRGGGGAAPAPLNPWVKFRPWTKISSE